MVCIVGLNSSNGHWPNVYEDLWANLQDKANYKSPSLGIGTDVKLCLSDGKISLHRSKLIKFTTLLDFSYEDLNNAMDPWGVVTLILPNFRMESALALGRLIYCGDSGYVTNRVKKEISSVLRPELRKALVMTQSKQSNTQTMPAITLDEDVNLIEDVSPLEISNPKSQSKQKISKSVPIISIDEDQEECKIVNSLKKSQESNLVDLESENDERISEQCDVSNGTETVVEELETNPIFIHQPLDLFKLKTRGIGH